MRQRGVHRPRRSALLRAPRCREGFATRPRPSRHCRTRARQSSASTPLESVECRQYSARRCVSASNAVVTAAAAVASTKQKQKRAARATRDADAHRSTHFAHTEPRKQTTERERETSSRAYLDVPHVDDAVGAAAPDVGGADGIGDDEQRAHRLGHGVAHDHLLQRLVRHQSRRRLHWRQLVALGHGVVAKTVRRHGAADVGHLRDRHTNRSQEFNTSLKPHKRPTITSKEIKENTKRESIFTRKVRSD